MSKFLVHVFQIIRIMNNICYLPSIPLSFFIAYSQKGYTVHSFYIYTTDSSNFLQHKKINSLFKRPNSLIDFLNGEAVSETTFTTVQAE